MPSVNSAKSLHSPFVVDCPKCGRSKTTTFTLTACGCGQLIYVEWGRIGVAVDPDMKAPAKVDPPIMSLRQIMALLAVKTKAAAA
jgi:hypothetical protein